jgi:hypothetical protein
VNRKEALNVIGYIFGDLEEVLGDGLPGGKNEEWNYDDQLVLDIAQACKRWEDRQTDLEQPWSVSFFNGDDSTWETIESGLRKEEAYRVWWSKTAGATEQQNSGSHNYYYMCPESEPLDGRHRFEEEEDDFSYRYLLDKSFG